MPTRSVLYLTVQGLAVLAWWAGVLASVSFRVAFFPADVSTQELLALALPDALGLALGSFAAAFALARRWAWGRVGLRVLLGGWLYATLFAAGLVIFAGAPALGLVLMGGACLGTAACLRQLG